MKLYKHIVCATDFSPCGNAACQRSTELVKQFDAQITFLYVIENFPEERSNEFIAPEDIDPAKYRDTQAHKSLSELIASFGLKQANQQILFSMETAWHEIVQYAQQHNADLVVVGSHGKHGLASPLGSTASGVVNHASCDVLAVRSRE